MESVLATYMEMMEPPSGPVVPRPSPESRIELGQIARQDYLELYRGVSDGEWNRRPAMAAEALDRFLVDPANRIFVLRSGDDRVGLCEFEGVDKAEVELATFGLIGSARGRRLGSYLLDQALRSVWCLSPKRVWLRTDSRDHPKAQETYRRSGFRTFLERMKA